MRRFLCQALPLATRVGRVLYGSFPRRRTPAGPWRSLAPAPQPLVVQQSEHTVDGPVAAVHGRKMLSLAMAAVSERDLESWSR
jgi:hypothetical protein